MLAFQTGLTELCVCVSVETHTQQAYIANIGYILAQILNNLRLSLFWNAVCSFTLISHDQTVPA